MCVYPVGNIIWIGSFSARVFINSNDGSIGAIIPETTGFRFN